MTHVFNVQYATRILCNLSHVRKSGLQNCDYHSLYASIITDYMQVLVHVHTLINILVTPWLRVISCYLGCSSCSPGTYSYTCYRYSIYFFPVLLYY